MSIGHYENFPVASLLCPADLRPAIVAIYRFARTADDIADEGTAAPATRLEDLAAYADDLNAVTCGRAAGTRWAEVFVPLRKVLERHQLPHQPFKDLLDAFAQDVRNPLYPDRAALLDYCRRSANPVGRLLLHLYGVNDALSLARSDAICTALQLVNFWQDLGVDQQRGRNYLPTQDLIRHGLDPAPDRPLADGPQARLLVKALCAWAAGLMHQGAPLAPSLPGRVGWELRLVVQGGLRILDKIERLDHATLLQRPVLSALDGPLLLWRALRMTGPDRQ